MYDFILFENFHWAYNHYKDLCLIAELLKNNGYSVAIADVFQENKYCKIVDIPHVKIKSKKNINILPSKKKNKLLAYIENIYNKIKIDYYLCNVVKELIPLAKNFYVGSFHAGMSTRWLKLFPQDVKVFLWGLRSSRLYEYKFRPFSFVGINSYFLKLLVEDRENYIFFVSDGLIMNEFLEMGFSVKRLVLRPERYIYNIKISNNENKQFTLLTIGTIRPNKRVELIVNAIKSLNNNDIKYIIAGQASNEYETLLMKAINGVKNINRLNYRIPEKDFQNLYEESDFLILCDIRQKSLVTNGTMNEALLKGIPIIAPNYNPYKFFIEKYNIGIMFDPLNPKSIADAILQAKTKGKRNFAENIKEYQKLFLLDRVIVSFGQQINEILKTI